MKYIVLFVVVVIAVVPAVLAAADPEFVEKVTPVAQACQAEAGATDEDVKTFLAREELKTRGAKCLVKCVLEKMGIVKEGKLVSDEDILKVFHQVYAGNEKKLALADSVIANCAKLGRTEEDSCEVAAKMDKCASEHLQ